MLMDGQVMKVELLRGFHPLQIVILMNDVSKNDRTRERELGEIWSTRLVKTWILRADLLFMSNP